MQSLFTTLAYYTPSSAYTHSSSYAQQGMGHYDGFTLIGIGLIILCTLLGVIVQNRMMASMRQFSATPAPFSGADVAHAMLQANGIHDVRIISTQGQLTDHYNPANRTVNLSEDVYNVRSVAAMAVAAHECGHAIQHAQAYPWLSLRSQLVPLVSIGSKFGQFVLILGLILLGMGSGATVAWFGLLLFGTTTVFAFVTLPVEFDASRRALAWLNSSGMADRAMHGQAQTALRWAAMTYVSAALSSLAMLVYYALMILGRSNDRH